MNVSYVLAIVMAIQGMLNLNIVYLTLSMTLFLIGGKLYDEARRHV